MIKPIEKNQIPGINRGYTMDDIEEFYNSEADACEVFGSEKQAPDSLQSCYYAYYASVKRLGYPIKVIRRKNRVFLVKKNVGEK